MKKNVWFTVSGVLTILTSITFVIAGIICGGSIALVKSSEFKWEDQYGNPLAGEELLAAQNAAALLLTIVTIIMLVFAVLAIFQAVVYMKYASKSREEVKQHSGLIITAIVLSFLTAGILVGIFGILGYQNIGTQSTNSNVHEVSNVVEVKENPDAYEKVKKELADLDRLKASGLVNDEEYKQKRQDIINKM